MKASMPYFDLLEALAQPGCAVCRLVARDVDRYSDALLYEYTNEYHVHQGVRAGRGFCGLHMEKLLKARGSALGIAVLLEAALDEMLQVALPPPSTLARLFSTPARSAAEALEPDGPCIICAQLLNAEARCVGVFVDNIGESALVEAYAASGGFCLPHVRQVLRAIPDVTTATAFAVTQRQIWTKLQEELATYIAKSNIAFEDADFGPERDSWQRAADLLSGKAGVFGLRR